jgi:hypothetical protein
MLAAHIEPFERFVGSRLWLLVLFHGGVGESVGVSFEGE